MIWYSPFSYAHIVPRVADNDGKSQLESAEPPALVLWAAAVFYWSSVQLWKGIILSNRELAKGEVGVYENDLLWNK